MNHLHCKIQLWLRWKIIFLWLGWTNLSTNQKMCSIYQHPTNPQNIKNTKTKSLNNVCIYFHQRLWYENFCRFCKCDNCKNMRKYNRKTNLKPLKLLLALCRCLGSSCMAVPWHHWGPMGLNCWAVVVGSTMDGRAWSVSMPATVMGHSGNLGMQTQWRQILNSKDFWRLVLSWPFH